MKAVFLNITNEERENILNQHKTPYDGYAVKQSTPNEQPLFVQDFANDKAGITVSNSGEVTPYTNKLYMKESVSTCKECGMTEDMCECGGKEIKGIGSPEDFDYIESEMKESKPTNKVDIYDDLKSNFRSWEFDHETEEDVNMLTFILKNRHPEVDDEEIASIAKHWVGYSEPDKKKEDGETEEQAEFVSSDDISGSEPGYLEDETLGEAFKQSLKESLNMFKRIQNFS